MGIVREMLSTTFDMEMKTINMYIDKSNKFYREFRIPKRKEGYRTIYSPAPVIRMFQHFISERYLRNIRISGSATAYRLGKSILNNVEPHIDNQHFFVTDIKDFFNNIDYEKVTDILTAELNDLENEDILDIIKICTYNKTFVQGAVTSPIISNIFMNDFDSKIITLVKESFDGVYTRYSDDIVISSCKNLPFELVDNIKSILSEYNLEINQKKTYFTSYKPELVITGLKMVNKRITLNTSSKQKLKNMIYHKLKKRANANESAQEVLGHLNYLRSIDPVYFNRINNKYKIENKLLTDLLIDMIKLEIN